MTITAFLVAGLFFGLLAFAARSLVRGPTDVVLWFLLVFGLFYGLRPLLIVTGLDGPFPDEEFSTVDTPMVLTVTLLALSVYLAMVMLGVVVMTQSRVQGWGPFFVRADIDLRRAKVVVIVLTGVATVISVYLLARYGGVGQLILAAKVDKSLAGLYVLRIFPAVGALAAAATFLEAFRRPGSRSFAWMALACSVLNASYVLLWGSRTVLVVVAACIIFGLRRPGTRRTAPPRVWLRMLVGALLVVALAGGLRIARDTLTRGEVQEVFAGASVSRQVSLGTNAVTFDAAMLAFRDWPDKHEFRGGEDLYLGVVGVVPRFLWEGKPQAIPPGIWFRQLYEPGKINGWPMGAAALWYLNFGWFGLLLGGLLTGFLLGLVAAAQRRRPANPFNAAVALVFGVFVLGVGWDDGTLIQCVAWLVPLWMVGRFLTPRTAPRPAPSTAASPVPAARPVP